MSTPFPDVVASAREAAGAADDRAAVRTGEVESIDDLRAVSRLLESVWGRNDEGVPIGSEVLRSLVHAGGAVTVARDEPGAIVGAAVLALGESPSAYSLIAAASAGHSDRGIGHALKLRQRAWALDGGLTSIRWTFDPLVGRNARFNLTKLGASAAEYVVAFYGRMTDEINGDDESDRLVADWRLDSPRAVAAAGGTPGEPGDPDPSAWRALLSGPDGEPCYVEDDGGRWCRVPHDVVALRSTDPATAAGWRAVVREALSDAFGAGLVASGVTRSGWYRLSREAVT
ncbi:MAG: GNAT family N-acetyltransferase [Nocardioides sp.]